MGRWEILGCCLGQPRLYFIFITYFCILGSWYDISSYHAMAAATSTCNSTAAVFQNATQICGPYINALQSCSTSFVNRQDRFQIVNQTALCLNAIFSNDGNISDNITITYLTSLGSPPVIPNNGSCNYPDFMQILQTACTYDYGQLNYTCDDQYDPAAFQVSNLDKWGSCSNEALYQYWRCTNQKPYTEVAGCVEGNTVKVDWLPQFQQYNGADSCPSPNSFITKQIVSMLLVLVGTIFKATLGSLIWRKVKQLIGLDKGKEKSAYGHIELVNQSKGSKQLSWRDLQSQAASNAERKSDRAKPFELESAWILSTGNILRSIGKELVNACLTINILHKAGLIGAISPSDVWWQAFYFLIIRPRVAPFTGILGFFKGFSETGFADVFADWMISWAAGSLVLGNYWYLVDSVPANPAAPQPELKLLAIGAILSCIPAFFFLVIALIIGLIVSGTIWAGLHAVFGAIAMILALYLFIPILGGIELLAAGIITIVGWIKKPSKPRKVTYWERPLKWMKIVSGTGFRIIYGCMVLSSFIINVGNWLFFVNFLKLQGDLFCPSEIKQIGSIWFIVPVAIDMAYYAYAGLTSP